MPTYDNDASPNFHSFKRWGKHSNTTGCVEYSFNKHYGFNFRMMAVTAALLSVLIGSCAHLLSNKSTTYTWLIFSMTFVLFALVFIVKYTFCVEKESLYVISPIGIQFISTYISGSQSVLFIPWHSFKNFIIVEMIIGQGIYFYLAVQSKTESGDKLVVLFEHTRPRLSNLEEMYRVITKCINH